MSFAECSRQQQAVRLLQRSLELGRLAHAYLFTGAELAALEELARTLAKTLNCSQPPRRGPQRQALDSCDQCRSCRKIDDFLHPDIQWIRPESKLRVITIGQMRELIEAVNLKPTEAAFKVAVIVGADRLNSQAANAFLKTLEEPPARSILILLSTEPQRVLETILSRCLRLNSSSDGGNRIDPAQVDWLGNIGEAAGEKGLLSRYRLLGTLLSRLARMKAEIEAGLTAKSPLEKYEDAEPELREKWEDELSAAIEAEYRRQRMELLLAMQWWLRDVWFQTLNLPGEMLSLPQLTPQTTAVGERISSREAMENLQVLERMQRLLHSNVQEALVLEVGLLQLRL